MKRNWIICLTVAGIMLRLALLLIWEPFWYDEAFSYLVARLPLDRLLQATAGDVHPPLYYLMLKAWLSVLGFMGRETTARLMSTILSLGALALYASLIRRMLPRSQAIVAWLIVLFMPSLVYYAAEARMYALLECFILAALVILTGYSATRRGDIARAVAGGVLLCGAMLTHNAGILWAAVIVAALYVAAIGWPRFQGRALIAGGIALSVWAVCWAPVFIQQLRATQVNYWTWAPTLGTAAYMQFLSVFFSAHLPDNGLDALLMMLVAALTTWGALAQARRRPWLLILALGFPVLAFVGSHVAGVGMLLHRLMVPGAFFVAILWASILTRRDVGRAMTALLILSLVYINGMSLWQGRTGCTYEPVLTAITSARADLLYGNNSAVIPLSLYSGVPAAMLANSPDPLGAGLSLQTLAALGVPAVALEDLPAWDSAYLVWFRIPGSTETEADYIHSLIARYNGIMTVANLGDNKFTHGDLYRMERQ